MIKPVKIKSRLIGPGRECFIIAEAGVNHNGNMSIAHKLIDVAVEAGADAVKFQIFNTNELAIPNAEKADYQIRNTGIGGKQIDVFKKLELSPEQHLELKKHCDEANILYCCTPYDIESADILIKMKVEFLKIASTDTTNIPFLRYIGKLGVPTIVSTGMCTLCEVEAAIKTLKELKDDNKIILLHCTAEYPAVIEESNLSAIKTLQSAFSCPVGFSDHTLGVEVGPWSVLIGGCVLEKHFTLDKKMEGLDHKASLEPIELKKLIRNVKLSERAIGDGIKRIMPGEISNKLKIQKSIVAKKDIIKGTVLENNMLSCKRPGNGLKPHFVDLIVGATAITDISENSLISLKQLRWK